MPLTDAERYQKLWYAGPVVIICPKEKVSLLMLESSEYATIKAIMRSC